MLMDDHLCAVQNNHHAALEHIEQFDARMKMAQACAVLRRPGYALPHHIPMRFIGILRQGKHLVSSL